MNIRKTNTGTTRILLIIIIVYLKTFQKIIIWNNNWKLGSVDINRNSKAKIRKNKRQKTVRKDVNIKRTLLVVRKSKKQ